MVPPMNATLETEIAQLNDAEKLTLIHKLWAMIDPQSMPVPPEVGAELDRRWAEHVRDPKATLTLDQLLTKVEAQRR